jgi:hypothetical protein
MLIFGDGAEARCQAEGRVPGDKAVNLGRCTVVVERIERPRCGRIVGVPATAPSVEVTGS